MQRFPSSMALFLMPLAAFADTKGQAEAAGAPVETVDMIYVIAFGIIFIGMIVGFLAYMWWRERKQKPDR